MSAYVKSLQAAVAADHARYEQERQKKAKVSRERLTPLEERLGRLLATIPADVQREGLSLASLQASLKGRWRGSCHPGELGMALRKLGYERRRNWTGGGGFSALWYPKE